MLFSFAIFYVLLPLCFPPFQICEKASPCVWWCPGVQRESESDWVRQVGQASIRPPKARIYIYSEQLITEQQRHRFGLVFQCGSASSVESGLEVWQGSGFSFMAVKTFNTQTHTHTLSFTIHIQCRRHTSQDQSELSELWSRSRPRFSKPRGQQTGWLKHKSNRKHK